MFVAQERPGVYWDDTVSGVLRSSGGMKWTGIAAECEKGEANRVYEIRRVSDGRTVFGENSLMAAMIECALANGAYGVKAVSAGTGDSADYESAFASLAQEDAVGAVCCDSSSTEELLLLKSSVETASQKGRERIAVGCFLGDSPETEANALNCERMILLCQTAGESAEGSSLLAAALAGRLSAATDPAASFNGLILEGVSEISPVFSEEDLDFLLENGVAVLESAAGRIELVRAVTTRTETDGEPDRTYHDINTVLIIDTVISGVRDSLQSMLESGRNNQATRSAIATQTAVRLEEFRLGGVIESYRTPVVVPSEEDPTICLVELEFTAARGLNQIVIQAGITI